MKHIFGMVVGILVLLITAQSWAQARANNPHGLYLSGNIGFGIHPDSDFSGTTVDLQHDPGLVINGAIGIELSPMIRFEGEIGLHNNTADLLPFTTNEFTFSMISFMGNGYFDIPTHSPLRPFVGAGLGFALAGVEEENVFGATSTDSDLVGAFQLMAGIGFDFSPRATFTFGYRYFTTTDPSFNTAFGPFEMEYSSHDFLFGARFRF
jgi:opacity protein-like surface antigen